MRDGRVAPEEPSTCGQGRRRVRGISSSEARRIRSAFDRRYPDVEDDQFSIERSGFIHEHPLTAIGVVLISSMCSARATLIAWPSSLVMTNGSYAPSPRTWKTAGFG